MKRICYFLLLAVLTSVHAVLADEVVFRKPFILKLNIDKENYYEESIGKVPFVHEGVVYLFKNDAFGINLILKNGAVTEIYYVPSSKKADIVFRFKQEAEKDGSQLMVLKITNNTKVRIFMDALMTVPGRKDIIKTTVLPIEPGLSGFESWPHPIVQLALMKFRTAP